MKDNKEFKSNAFFHEEAHIYFPDQESKDKFTKSFEKNREWAIKQRARWGAIPSITQFLGKIYPFTGGDLGIAKAWYRKEQNFLGADKERTEKVIKLIEEVEGVLDISVKRSQEEGNIGHELIQDFIEYKKLPEEGDSGWNNPYFKEFMNEINKVGVVSELVNSITHILPSEIPVIKNTGKFTYAGKWDLLVQLDNGKTALIDIKTGSAVRGDKLKKVGLQLNAYRGLVQEVLDVEVDLMMCWELSYTQDKETGVREYYFKSHDIEKSDTFFKLVETQLELERLKKEV